ncbi:MAG: hypothetical protein ABI794_17090 [Betaproteobacteria bacterium]
MPDATTLSATECDAMAKALRTAADAAKEARKSLDGAADEYADLQQQEDELRDLADRTTAVAIERDTLLPDLSAAHLQAAMDAANETLAGLGKARATIRVIAGLVDFATAVLSRKPKAIWDSARILKGRIDAVG